MSLHLFPSHLKYSVSAQQINVTTVSWKASQNVQQLRAWCGCATTVENRSWIWGHSHTGPLKLVVKDHIKTIRHNDNIIRCGSDIIPEFALFERKHGISSCTYDKPLQPSLNTWPLPFSTVFTAIFEHFSYLPRNFHAAKKKKETRKKKKKADRIKIKKEETLSNIHLH